MSTPGVADQFQHGPLDGSILSVIAVVIPCHRVRQQIASVLASIGPEVAQIWVVDDACPEKTGELVAATVSDPRVRIIRHTLNQGVGGAVVSGYKAAIAAGATIIVKLDGDGQMDASMIPQLVEPVIAGMADYTKGNRFFDVTDAANMPAVRKIGNLALSFLTKLSSGYWGVFDPTNGFTAIHATAAALLPFDKISRRYFFESDMLFRLGTIDAVVCDIPMTAKYAGEQSGIRIASVLPEFTVNNLRNFAKRIVYSYFLRDFNLASIELLLAALLLTFGTVFGVYEWNRSSRTGTPASAGTVMLSALPILLGAQLLIAFLNYDVTRAPQIPIHRRTRRTSAHGRR